MKPWKIYFILSEENLFHPYFFLGVIQAISKSKKEYHIVGVTVIKDMNKNNFINLLHIQYKLWGILGFISIAYMSLKASILSKFNVKPYCSIRSIARIHNISLIETENVNNKIHLNYVKNYHPDVIVSSCGQIFKRELLSIPRIACINRHTALLPKYGGVLPVFWAMYYGEKEFGVSVHLMTEKIDQGNILAQVTIPFKKESSLFKNYILGFEQSIPITLTALSNLKKNKIIGVYYKNPRAYFSFPDNKTLTEFKKKFKTFFWSDIITHEKFIDGIMN